MTTLMTVAHAEAVRCDRCRLVWPRAMGSDTGWLDSDSADLHLCPRCVADTHLTADERAAVERGSPEARRLLALSGPGHRARRPLAS